MNMYHHSENQGNHLLSWLATHFGDYDTGQHQQQKSARYYSIMHESHHILKSHESQVVSSSKTIAEKLTASPFQSEEYFKVTVQVPCACKSPELEKLKNS